MSSDTIAIGQSLSVVYQNTDINCSCHTKNNKRCSNEHKLLYKLSNGTSYFSCNISSHKKYIFEQFLTNGITADVYRLKFHSYTNRNFHCTYIACGVSVDNTCNYEHPIIRKRDTIANIKQSLLATIETHDRNIGELKETINEFYKYITNLRNEINMNAEAKIELYRTINLLNSNTTFSITNSIVPNENDVCAICHETMTHDNAGQLYECNHSYHYKCIKRWFEKKTNISCPCCRTTCNVDNYFILNKFL